MNNFFHSSIGCFQTPFSVLLTVLFFALKVTGFIGWPWICVLIPLWLPFSVAFLLYIIFALFAGVIALGLAITD